MVRPRVFRSGRLWDVGIRFGESEVDLDRMELRLDGELVSIEPQVFDVLAYLIEHRDRLVTKEELLDNVWGDRFVSESALTSRIKSARQAVGDNGRDQAVIRTVHGRGYRFVAEIREAQPAAVAAVTTTTESESSVGSSGSDHGSGESDDWPLVGRHVELAELNRLFHDPNCGGILLSGPIGIGKTRLATECIALADQAGWPTATVHGQAEAGVIPLASMAHLLPADVLTLPNHDGDMARAVVFQRAREALEMLAGGRRLVLFVDNVDHVDDLSRALVGSLIGAGTAFAVMTQRTSPGDAIVMEDLVRSTRVAHIELDPLDDTDLDVLLYRVLAGPIEMASLDQLTSVSEGRPGALQQIVRSCLSTRTLERQSDVWRLVGPLQPSVGIAGAAQIAIADLEPEVRRAAELLAVAEDLDLDLASELVGVEALDALDRLSLLAVTEDAHGARVSLAHAHIAILLLDALGQLRLRRHKGDLVAAMAQAQLTEEDDLRRMRWRVELGEDVPRSDVLGAARFAVNDGDVTTAEILLDHLAAQNADADVVYLRAELCWRRGQMSRAEQLLDWLDLSELEPLRAASAARRQSTLLFHIRGRFDEGLDLLESRFGEFGAEAELLLRAHWVGLNSFFGRALDVISEGESLLPRLDGAPELEVLRSLGQSHMLAGSIHEALRYLDEHERKSAGLSPGVAMAGNETAIAAQISAHMEYGSMQRAIELVRLHLPVGRRTMLAWLPMTAARAELAAGRPRAARELISTPLAAVQRQNLIFHEPLMTAIYAQTFAHTGDLERARREVTPVESMIPGLDGQLQFALVLAAADVWTMLGDHDHALDLLRKVADRAGELGTVVSEARIRAAIAALDDASAEVERVEALASAIDGPYWSLRARHVRAMAEGHDVGPEFELEYRRMGHNHLADLLRGIR